MSSGQKALYDELEYQEKLKERRRKKSLLEEAIKELERIRDEKDDVAFEKFEWLYKYKKRILNNRKLIELIDSGWY